MWLIHSFLLSIFIINYYIQYIIILTNLLYNLDNEDKITYVIKQLPLSEMFKCKIDSRLKKIVIPFFENKKISLKIINKYLKYLKVQKYK